MKPQNADLERRSYTFIQEPEAFTNNIYTERKKIMDNNILNEILSHSEKANSQMIIRFIYDCIELLKVKKETEIINELAPHKTDENKISFKKRAEKKIEIESEIHMNYIIAYMLMIVFMLTVTMHNPIMIMRLLVKKSMILLKKI